MVLFTILLLTMILGAVCMVVAAVVGGGMLLLLFGDVFVFAAIVALIVRIARRVRCR